ncbi:AGE family epimerase/isomerase [Burkholderiaceae bacterium UC74_6]
MGTSARALLASLGFVALLAGCERASAPERNVDAAWHRQALVDHALKPWLERAPQPDGFMRTAFARDWQPLPNAALRQDVINQSRLVYALASGFMVTGDRRYLQAARSGADFLQLRFHDEVQGGYFTMISANGTVLNDRKRSYGQAFVILAFAQMAQATGEARYKELALKAWREASAGLLEPSGGLVDRTSRDFKPEDPGHTQNPVMHMFEALTLLTEVTGDASARAATRALGDFVINRLMQGLPDGSARIPEWYDTDWKPFPTREKGGYIDLGHQFEWVHLLYRAQRLEISPIYGGVAERILQYALKEGYDEIDGGAFEKTYPDGGTERAKHYWQQLECLHGLMAAASADPRRELWRRYEQTLDLVRKQFVDTQHGGWQSNACSAGGGQCPDEQPEPYHMVSLHLAALAEAGFTPGSAASGASR